MKGTNRRTFVKIAGAAAIAPAIAGCTGSGGSDGNGGGSGGSGGGDVPQEVDDYLSDANEYGGSVEDHTGEDEVTVEVGAGGNGLAFVPTAIRVDAGTTVVWEWTGEGGAHNVVDEDGAFESEMFSEEGETFEQAFEEAGNYRYFCQPHKASGMKGAVVVE